MGRRVRGEWYRARRCEVKYLSTRPLRPASLASKEARTPCMPVRTLHQDAPEIEQNSAAPESMTCACTSCTQSAAGTGEGCYSCARLLLGIGSSRRRTHKTASAPFLRTKQRATRVDGGRDRVGGTYEFRGRLTCRTDIACATFLVRLASTYGWPAFGRCRSLMVRPPFVAAVLCVRTYVSRGCSRLTT